MEEESSKTVGDPEMAANSPARKAQLVVFQGFREFQGLQDVRAFQAFQQLKKYFMFA